MLSLILSLLTPCHEAYVTPVCQMQYLFALFGLISMPTLHNFVLIWQPWSS